MRGVLATSVDVPATLLVIGGVITTLTALGAAWAVFRTAAIRASQATIIEANAELRRANDDLRHEVALEKEKRAELDVAVGDVFTLVHPAQTFTEAWRRTHPYEGGSTS